MFRVCKRPEPKLGSVAHAVTCPLISSHTISSVEARCNSVIHQRLATDNDYDSKHTRHAMFSLRMCVGLRASRSCLDKVADKRTTCLWSAWFYWSLKLTADRIGLARGAVGAPAPPGRWKKFFRPNLQEKCVSAPQPEQESIFRIVFAGFGGIF